ncbi:MAG: hypothetical protein JW829_00340 [Pirellulales bacterium]|nr:hypothetical protein [Pirellulales bacterium]
MDIPFSKMYLAWIISLAWIAGCSQTDGDRMKVYPVHGTVTVDGRPAEGVEIVFFGATEDLKGKGTVAPYGTTDENGVYHLRSYDPGDGAPAGKFKVSIIWPEPTPPGAAEETMQRIDRFKSRYANPEKSGLTAEVPEGGGEIPPFKL